MNRLSFMTIGDSGFFHTIRYSIRQIARFYPDSPVYVYDWGFTGQQRIELEGCGATVVPWRKKIGYVPVEKYVPDNKLTASMVARFHIKRWFFRQRFARQQRSLFIFMQKPTLILDCLRRCGGNLVFLDGDALLAATIDEVFEDEFNVGVTLRRQHEIRLPSRDGECQALNVGVMFFKGPLGVLETFIRRWDEEVAVTRDYCIEQTALSNLVETTRADIYSGYNRTGVLDAHGESVKIKVFPCEMYNFNWIEEGFDTARNKILHFKGHRHAAQYFDELRTRLGLDENL